MISMIDTVHPAHMQHSISCNPRVALLGDRSSTWMDEAEEAEFAGLQQPFTAIWHTMQTIYH